MRPTVLQTILDALAAVEFDEEQNGGSRELSLIRTKLQEAYLWEVARYAGIPISRDEV